MDNKHLSVSLSPHTFDKVATQELMVGVLKALLPALAVSLSVFGIGALRIIIVAVSSCVLSEYFIQRFFIKGRSCIQDGSAAVTGLLLAFNLPSNLPLWMVMLGSLVAIGIGKMSFGGIGNNPFNPALVGRVFLLISFPVAMTSWPKPIVNRWVLTDAVTGATPLTIAKEGLQNGEPICSLFSQLPSAWHMFTGTIGGCIGEVSAFALLVGFLYMFLKKIVTWHIPVSMIGSIGLLTLIFWLIDPSKNMDPIFHILTGGILLGAFFMATDYTTSPMTPRGMLIYGTSIGVLTVIIRVFGAYPEGVSFAILIMNAFVPLINRHCKPKRFGEGGNALG